MFTLTGTQQEYLLSQPETGMGYQLVDILTENHRALLAIAYNAELVLALNEPHLRARFEAYAAGLLEKGAGARLSDISVRVRDESSNTAFSTSRARAADGAPAGLASCAPALPTKGREVFKRFSAFRHDRRIQPDGSLLSGSYATTEEDARQVRSGRAAVARYALPNPTPAVNVFTIVPQPATLLQSGFAEPAPGQGPEGAIVQVVFPAGTTAHTVSGPIIIPPD